jgi:O-antigen/teichoic acid export membrane protein
MSFAKHSFSVFKRDIFLFGLNLLTSVVIARKLGPELLGVYVILMLIPGYAEAFGRTKFDLAAVYFIGKGKYKEQDVLYHLNIIAILSSFLIIIPIIFFVNFLNQILFDGATEYKNFIFTVLPLITLQFLYSNYSYLLISRENIKMYNRMTILKAVIGSGGASIFLLFLNYGLWSVLIPNLLAGIISLIYGICQYRKAYWSNSPRNSIDKILLKDFFNYSYKLYLGGIISYLNLYLMKSILSLYLIPAKVAFFSMAQDRATLLDKIPAAVNTILYPKVSNVSNIEASTYTINAFRIILILVSFSAIALAIVIKPAVILLYGEAFSPMIIPMLIILPGIIMNGSTSVISQFFTGIGRSDLVMKLSFTPLLSQLFLGFLLIKHFGIYGAAFSFSLAMVFLGLSQILSFLKVSGNSIKVLIPQKNDFIYIKNFITSKFNYNV